MATVIVKNGKITILTKDGRQDISYSDIGVIDQDVATRQILKTVKNRNQEKQVESKTDNFVIKQGNSYNVKTDDTTVQVEQDCATHLIDKTKVSPAFVPDVVPVGIFPDVVPVGVRKEKKNDVKILSQDEFNLKKENIKKENIKGYGNLTQKKLSIDQAPEKSILSMVAKTLSSKKQASEKLSDLSSIIQNDKLPQKSTKKQKVSKTSKVKSKIKQKG